MANANATPESPTRLWINVVGLLCSLLAVAAIKYFKLELPVRTTVAVLVCLALALPIILLEAWRLKPQTNSSAGLQLDKRRGNWPRTVTKLIGFYACLGLVALVYWILPEYHGDFYQHYFFVLFTFLPYWLVLAIPYFYFVDSAMQSPKDAYWRLGRLILAKPITDADRANADIGQLFLGWLVKLFFLPLMFVYLGNNLDTLLNSNSQLFSGGFQQWFDFAFNFLYYIDLLIVTVGYVFTLRLLDSHIRSTEPSLLGWAVALMCYQPFWSLFSGTYIQYDQGPAWGHWFWQTPWAYGLWGTGILALLMIYVWASMAFGIRFSNLTHRGILTNGPFQFTKHPAYVSKNLSWWMISMPFMVSASLDQTLRQCAMLLLLNGVYFLRARTEEKHLSRDTDYVVYANYMEQHGMFAWLGRWLPWLRFAPGKLFANGEKFAQKLTVEKGAAYVK
ncbi:isoprenylcysteine carboxylmethyltransferase family protein [Simiduia litorea]|uniref:isoprenylcysteine carboxylmethyltransferase family protein n=1 Tax=Simiduia litorea TaxID=1435348 RepID=UPI0036F291D6